MAKPAPYLSIVIPAYNEAGRLPKSLALLAEYMSTVDFDVEVIVVDDGSEDDTAALVERSDDILPAQVLREPHRGKGGAVRAGMLAAAGRYRLLADADLSMPPREIPRFLEMLSLRCDVVVGCRESSGAKRIGEPVARHVIGRVFNAFARALRLTDLPDTQCGFKAFTSDAAVDIFSRLAMERFAFDLEVLALAGESGYRVRSLPIEWHYDPDSRVSALSDSLDMFKALLSLRWRLLKRKMRPASVAEVARS